MIWMLLLLCIAVDADAPFQIKCGELEGSTFLQVATAPLRHFLSRQMHGMGDGSCPTKLSENTFKTLEIATWPQYMRLNRSATEPRRLRISGFAYALDNCRSSWSYRRETLRNFLSLSGGDRLLPPSSPAAMSGEYVSHSVAGAGISLIAKDTAFHSWTTTNLYGHFDAFIDLPPRLQLDYNASQLRVDGCDPPLNLESAIPSTKKSFKILPLTQTGITVISDIDDVLKKSEGWNLKRLCLYTYVHPFQPWLNMPEVFKRWRDSNLKDLHFHYSTDAPEMSHSAYTALLDHYPLGSFDFRPWSLVNVSISRIASIERLITTFPHREYILMGDDSTPGQLSAYVDVAKRYPTQVNCLVLRRSSKLLDNVIDPNMKQLEGVRHLLFTSPNQLLNITPDVIARECGGLADTTNNITTADDDGLHVVNGTTMSGGIRSWINTFTNFRRAFSACYFLGLRRPSHLCPFDLRYGTAFVEGGRMKEEGDARAIAFLTWFGVLTPYRLSSIELRMMFKVLQGTRPQAIGVSGEF
ncbi:uncharacterized protein MYCFIDRAFT_79139 [Pseudocercospora fijiensis CIRAD86]|uniref:Phosphatidate phosphatase APP1 catalytic domain-containing protein n=1 Tax=Pseudocercospora fijiensis (strain CIRAD86) TaxID=383855 RepID=M3AK98_PSEFD|nr:uncharacterized protein MYCFIDRAFT_79139 [Pseudocercospora fijiensis CIRAD86]EME77887.1 hypothetical protein MYCFIDRAFT_79139 [Pseudocercospora fijiensis CIRAD86]